MKNKHEIWISRVYVNAYEVTREYGGPEEGGWYYDAGEPMASVPVSFPPFNIDPYHECDPQEQCDGYETDYVDTTILPDEVVKRIDQAQQLLRRELSDLNDARSMFTSRLVICVCRHIGKSFPVGRPRYE